jgi:hypothetical protein
MKKNKSSAPSSLPNKKQLVARLKELLAKAEDMVKAANQNKPPKKTKTTVAKKGAKPAAKRAAKPSAKPTKKSAKKKAASR